MTEGHNGDHDPSRPTLQLNTLAQAHLASCPNLITNVWRHNLAEELAKITALVDEYPYIAMDTEFPGIVARPAASFQSSNEYAYQKLRCNVDLLKLIQLGLCFCDSEGHIHPGTCVWQFNFHFSLATDMYAQDSIDLLSKSGIDFAAHESDGIDTQVFAEWLMTSGIVLNDEVRFISFHSGYDFAYLLKLLTNQPLPSKEEEFLHLLQIYFPCIYDIKVMLDAPSCSNLHGGLSKIAESLGLVRIGPQHQAGSDSLLTAATFFKLKQTHFNESTDARWAETNQHRNAVRRETRLSVTAPSSAFSSSSSNSSTSSNSVPLPRLTDVITNTAQLSEFDLKYMGALYGMNNDFTSAWKRKQESLRRKRLQKEQMILDGLDVSSDEDEDDEPMSAGMNDSRSTSTTASSSPHFVPQSHNTNSMSGGHISPYPPSTPQKHTGGGNPYSSPSPTRDLTHPHSHTHSHAAHHAHPHFSPSTHHHHGGGGGGKLPPKPSGIGGVMHRNTHTHRTAQHDYS